MEKKLQKTGAKRSRGNAIDDKKSRKSAKNPETSLTCRGDRSGGVKKRARYCQRAVIASSLQEPSRAIGLVLLKCKVNCLDLNTTPK